MQINRLFEIIYILLDKKSVTAGELAQRFEVSTRTIYRDVDILSGSGVPIFMTKGKGGGIRLLDNFVMDRFVLSEQEQQEILSALQGLGAMNYPETEKVLLKLSSIFNKNSKNWIEVDFSGWSGDEEKWNTIKFAILNRKVITFVYYNRYGEKTIRQVMPLQLKFKEKNWYLKAFCMNKQSERTFKLSRIKALQITGEKFEEIPEDAEDWPGSTGFNNIVTLRLKIDSSQAYRVYDEFEESQVEKEEDGNFIVTVSFMEDEWVYGFILSFGCFAKVLSPPHICGIIEERLIKTLNLYR